MSLINRGVSSWGKHGTMVGFRHFQGVVMLATPTTSLATL